MVSSQEDCSGACQKNLIGWRGVVYGGVRSRRFSLKPRRISRGVWMGRGGAIGAP